MKQSRQIEQKIDRILDCFHEPGPMIDPDFVERVCRRFTDKVSPARTRFAPVPGILRPALIGAVVLFNLISVYLAIEKTRTSTQVRLDSINKLSSEYQITTNLEPFPNR